MYFAVGDGLTFSTQDFLGPLAALVLALAVLFFVGRQLFLFIREYIKSLLDRIAQGDAKCDECEEQLKAALAGWQAQTDANKTLAQAQEARNRDDELRHRLADAEQARPQPRPRRT